MLAGNIKLKHFVAAVVVFIVLCGGIAVLGPGAAILARLRASGPSPAVEVVSAPPTPVVASTPAPAAAPAAASPAPAAPAAPAPTGGRPVDQAIFQWVGKDLGTTKRKDVTAGRPYKVNLYQDAGHTTVNRAKVDLDRDDKWDEKWTIDGTSISRKVAPNDDENYTERYLWTGTDWAKQ